MQDGQQRQHQRVDRTRQLHALDPTGRQLMISIGCALFNARVAAADLARPMEVERMPFGANANPIARLRRIDVPHYDAGSGDEIPIRDFDSTGAGWLPTDTQSHHNQCLLLLGTDGDQPDQWLRAGEALERVWLEIARHGFVMSPLTQVVEVATIRSELRLALRTTMYPHILMRVGRAAPTPGVGRRHLDDLLIETDGT